MRFREGEAVTVTDPASSYYGRRGTVRWAGRDTFGRHVYVIDLTDHDHSTVLIADQLDFIEEEQ